MVILAGFLSQIVDGGLIAYGVTSTSILLSFGLSTKLAPTSVQTAKWKKIVTLIAPRNPEKSDVIPFASIKNTLDGYFF